MPAPPQIHVLRIRSSWAAVITLLLCARLCAADAPFDLVIRGGRVIDPESGLDGVRNVGIRDGSIAAVTADSLPGRKTIDATGLVVAPGFIDLHQHGQTPEDYALKAQDGVTTVGELEVGTADVDAWYAERAGKSPVNFAVSSGHIPSRMIAMGDAPGFLPAANSATALKPADDAQLATLLAHIERGLQRGAVAVGMGLQYTPGATQWEILQVYRVAAKYDAHCDVHLRGKNEAAPVNLFSSLEEVVAATALTGAATQVCHVQATANLYTNKLLSLIQAARDRGLDVSVECYPYTAAMTDISSAVFDPGWQERTHISYGDLQWPATGERLTAESFARYRKSGGMVIIHSNPESVVSDAVANPMVMIASDGIHAHPRNAGTSARVLGRYVRELKVITLPQAIAKLSLLPAQRLERRVPSMRNKGRIRPGADADVVVFDPDKVADRATFTQPDIPSAGIEDVLVGGQCVVRNGARVEGVLPGRAVRAAVGDSSQ